METTKEGWVVMSETHPYFKGAFIIESSFAQTRKQCLSNFMKNSDLEWIEWKKQYGFKIMKAESTIKISN